MYSNPSESPSLRNGRDGMAPPAVRCHCCSSTFLSDAPVRSIVIKVLANGANLDKPKNEKEVERVKTVTLQVTPEQAEKLALASSEGRLQLVMRNSIDQGDEVTTGATKRTLLSGERALPLPEPGPGKDAPVRTASPKRARPRVVAASETAVKVNTPAPPPARPSIEVIEGSKKKNVDFP